MKGRYNPFINNISIKGLKIDYDKEEILPSIYRFILKYIQNLNEVLYNIERVGITISREKSQFYMLAIRIMRYIYNREGRHPNIVKIKKIMNQLSYKNPTKLRDFLEIYVYYRIQIKGFIYKAKIFYYLLKKGIEQ